MCSVISCQKCPFSDKCYFSLSHKFAEKIKVRGGTEQGKILIVEALKGECKTLSQKLYEIGKEFNLDIVLIGYDSFMDELEDHLHKVASEKYAAIIILVDNKNYIKSLIYPIMELEEMGANLLVVLPKQIHKRIAKFKLNTLGVEDLCNELDKVMREIRKIIKFPVKNIYLVEYPKPIEKALNEGLLLVIDLPLKASRRWILLKYFSGDKFVRENISKHLDSETQRKLRDLTMKLWCDLGIAPAYEINKAKEKLIDMIKNSLGA